MSRIVLWVSDIKLQAAFYSALFDTTAKSSNSEFLEVSDSQNCVLLHLLPEPFRTTAEDVLVQDEVAIKPVFAVSDIDLAQSRVTHFNVSFGSEKNIFGDQIYLDCIDPEGNVIQLSQKVGRIVAS